jgi:hypothetical protein
MKSVNDNPQQRLSILTALLLWEGRLNNSRLRQLFQISSVRASEWMREFREKYPDLLELDSKTKSYLATSKVYQVQRRGQTPSFNPASTLSLYLTLVGLPHSTQIPQSPAICAAFPDISPPNPRLFALFSDAIRTHRMVVITYRSMRDPQPHKRTLSPHSIVRAGRRWHIRAYCEESQGFRDYSLGRIVDVQSLGQAAEHGDSEDIAWSTMVKVRLIAHPLLTTDQQDLIRCEYFNNTAARVDTCRGALVAYFIQDVRAALSPKEQRPPDYQLAVANLDEVRPWVFPA